MLYPISQLKIVQVNTLPVGTFVKVISHTSVPVLGVVVAFSEQKTPGFFLLEGPLAYSVVQTNLRGYVCAVDSDMFVEIPDPETTTTNRYRLGQLAMTDGGSFIVGKFGPDWNLSSIYVELASWNTSLGLGEISDPTFFDQWSFVRTDAFANKEVIFSGRAATG